jgi:hypothetical protein
MIMKKISAYKDFINEGIRDKMTPKSEEDIKNSVGEKKYNIYKSLSDAKDSIKSPYETDNLSFMEMLMKSVKYIEVRIRFLIFTISYDGDLWRVIHHYNKSHTDHYNTWDEAWNGIIEFTDQSLNNEISLLEKEINRDQENIKELKELLSKITLDKSINEGVRELMTPKDNEELREAIKGIFDNASKDGMATIDADVFEYWDEMSEEYILIDNYYLYKNQIFFLYDNWQEGGDPLYQLSVVYRDVNKFKEKLEKAIKKLNTL